MFGCTGFEILASEKLSNFFFYLLNFVFLSHKQAKLVHTPFWTMKIIMQQRKQSCFGQIPVSLCLVFAICCRDHFERSKKKVLDWANFLIFLNSDSDQLFFNRLNSHFELHRFFRCGAAVLIKLSCGPGPPAWVTRQGHWQLWQLDNLRHIATAQKIRLK